MQFLKDIQDHKKKLISSRQDNLADLKIKAENTVNTRGYFLKAINKNTGIGLIAEIKVKSPSKGDISIYSVEELAGMYEKAGTDCVSVLTEDRYFGGSLDNIKKVKSICKKPVLMKDFIISEYQIYEGVAAGADAVLLIAAILSGDKLAEFVVLCRDLGISALVEIHSAEELRLCADIEGLELIGVNSRNLKTLELDDNIHRKIVDELPSGVLKVAESGIFSKEQVDNLYDIGYNAVLIGEWIVASEDPEAIIKEIKSVTGIL